MRSVFKLRSPAFGLSAMLLLCACGLLAQQYAPVTYINPASGSVLPYVPTICQVDATNTNHCPVGAELWYLQLNTMTSAYELHYCAATPGMTLSNICNSGSDHSVSTTTAFKAAFGCGSACKTIGRFMISPDGLHGVLSMQNPSSTLVGYGPVSDTGVCTADVGIGCDHDIYIVNMAALIAGTETTLDVFKITSQTCMTFCAGDTATPQVWGKDPNGLQTVPINGTRGGYFPIWLADSHTAVWGNITCVVATTGGGGDTPCTKLQLGTDIETATITFGTPLSSSTISSVATLAPLGGGVTCSGITCTLVNPQIGYEVEHRNLTDPFTFYAVLYTYPQNGNTIAVQLKGSVAVRALSPVCPASLVDIYLCQWNEHAVAMLDGLHLAVASTLDAVPNMTGNPTASPVLFSSGNYPNFQELEWVTAPSLPLSMSAIPITNQGQPHIRLTGFNDPLSNNYVGAGCHTNFASVETAIDQSYVLLNTRSSTSNPNTPCGSHGGTYGYAFAIVPLPTATITSPTPSQFITSVSPLPLNVTIANAPMAYSAQWSIDGQRWGSGFFADQHPTVNDFKSNYIGSLGMTWWTGLNGDGPHTASVTVTSIGGVPLATVSQVFTVNVQGMANQSFNAVPTSGIGKWGWLSFDGTNSAQDFYIDGYPMGRNYNACGRSGATSQSGGTQLPSFDTTCVTNTTHQLLVPYNIGSASDPYILNATVAAVSGTTLNANGHTITTGDIVTFSNTGGALPPQLTAGVQCQSASSATRTCAVNSFAVSSGTITVTTSVATGATTGTPVYVRNIASTGMNGLSLCDGYYTAAAGTTTSSILITAPAGCANGTSAAGTFEIAVHPYCATYKDVNDFYVSTSFTNPTIPGSTVPTCGSQISLTSGSGTTTVTKRDRSPYWGGNSDSVSTGGQAYILRNVTFSNGSHTMEIDPPYWDYRGYFGKTGDTLCPTNGVKNTDLTFTATACSAYAYSLTADGGITGAISVNSSTGAITYAASSSWSNTAAPFAWAYATVSCMSCGTGGVAIPSVGTMYIENCGASPCTFPHYSPTGIIQPFFNPGTSHWMRDVEEVGELGTTNYVTCGATAANITAATWSNGVATVTTATSLGVSSGSYLWSINATPTGYYGNFWVTVTSTTSFTYLLPTNPGVYISGGTVSTSAACRSSWVGPTLQQSGFNATFWGLSVPTALSDPSSTSCPVFSSPGSLASVPQMYYEELFSQKYGISLEFDLQDVLLYNSADIRSLAAILNKTNYDRHACLQAMISHFVSSGLYTRLTLDDEVTFIYGSMFRPNPLIGHGQLNTIAVSGATTTFNFSALSQQVAWSQSTGLGSWLQVVSATNSCLNGWYPMNTVTNTGAYTTAIVSTNNGGCSNGTYEPSGGVTETTAQFILGPSPLAASNNNQQNISAIPANLSVVYQPWSGAFTQISVSSCVATVSYTGNLIPSGTAIRLWGATTAHLMTVAPVASVTNSLTYTYAGTTGQTCPANGTYNSSTDPGLTLSVDANQGVSGGWGPDPMGKFYSLINGTTASIPILGNFFSTSTTPTVQSYEGNYAGSSTAATNAFLYNGNPAPSPTIYGIDGSANQWMTISQGSGLLTRAYQSQPRSMLWGAGSSYTNYCQSFYFNPGCDHPFYLGTTAEGIIAQRYGFKALGISMDRLYNAQTNTGAAFGNCCGFSGPGGEPYTSINHFTSPQQWNAGVLFNSEVAQDERWELQPEANKPNFGPMFITDAHTSAVYGNYLSITCGSQMPYGAFPISTQAISNGTLVLKGLGGYYESVQVIPNNPSSLTQEWCPTPGYTSILIAEPPGLDVMDYITFGPPAGTLPYGATQYLVRILYSTYDTTSAPATDCTNTCTLVVDHHSSPAWYQTLYAANGLPVGPSNPTPMLIASQNLDQSPDLAINLSNSGVFAQGDSADTYVINVTNTGNGPTVGMVTVVDTIPSGLTALLMSGSGWVCVPPTATCTRSDMLLPGSSYPAITLTVGVSTSAASSVTNVATVSGGDETNTSNDTASDVTPIIVTAVTFVTMDGATIGNWKGIYGQDGQFIPNNANNPPSYGVISSTNASAFTWAATTTNPLALIKADPATDRIASAYSPTTGMSFMFNIQFTDTAVHQVDGYFLDWDSQSRSETVTLKKTVTGATLDSRTVSSFTGGTHLVWNVSGNVQLTVTSVSGGFPVLNGLFFGSISPPAPDLNVTKTHTGSFTQGQTGATFTITGSNLGTGPTSGVVTITDTIPTGLTATAISGTGWGCTPPSGPCTRSDILASGASYPALTLTVNVGSMAPSSVTNTVTISGGGDLTSNTASDTAAVGAVPDMTITKVHSGNFSQGQTGATFTITASNSGAGVTSGTVTVTDTVPSGLTPTTAAGSGWTCGLASQVMTCTRSDALAASASYPAITLTVNVSSSAPLSILNTAAVSGGGELVTSNNSDTDTVTVIGSGYSIISHNLYSLGASAGTTPASNLVGATQITVEIMYQSGTTPVLTSSPSNSWTPVGSPSCNTAAGICVESFLSLTPATNSAMTFTSTGSVVSLGYQAASGGGVGVDGTPAAANGSGSALSIGPTTPTQNGDICLVALVGENLTGLAAGSPFSGLLDFLAKSAGVNELSAIAYITQATAASVTAPMSWTNSGHAAGQLACFSQTSGGTGGTTISVDAYGATGNGTTDDTQSQQNAINKCPVGGTVLWPAGTYKTTSPLTLNNNCTYKSTASAIIQAPRVGNSILVFPSSASSITITGLILDGAGIGIPNGGNNITITGATVRNIITPLGTAPVGGQLSYTGAGINIANGLQNSNITNNVLDSIYQDVTWPPSNYCENLTPQCSGTGIFGFNVGPNVNFSGNSCNKMAYQCIKFLATYDSACASGSCGPSPDRSGNVINGTVMTNVARHGVEIQDGHMGSGAYPGLTLTNNSVASPVLSYGFGYSLANGGIRGNTAFPTSETATGNSCDGVGTCFELWGSANLVQSNTIENPAPGPPYTFAGQNAGFVISFNDHTTVTTNKMCGTNYNVRPLIGYENVSGPGTGTVVTPNTVVASPCP